MVARVFRRGKHEGDRDVDFTFKMEYAGLSNFNSHDFEDMAALLTKLRDVPDPVSKHLRERLSLGFRNELDSYGGVSPPPTSLQQDLLVELNRLLHDDSVYDPKIFPQASLSPDGPAVILQYLPGDPPARFNRLLLAEAYPDEIKVRNIHFLDHFLESLSELSNDSSPQDSFFKLFRNLFSIQLTTENGWFEIPDYLPLSQVVDADLEKVDPASF